VGQIIEASREMSRVLRVVLDTNTVLSAVVFAHGRCNGTA
jgi:hypothetical protein